ncbi:hypothetical protein [Halopenitus sp. POP-27]|uniref:hypothetical protein n=1 Tax=Halopenitus sp. POP-27 TaxID=2994425 RepID=UPI0024691551|nr:hypothetical protein [Halopenitus sp. POP-27]
MALEDVTSAALQEAITDAVTEMRAERREALETHPSDRKRWKYDGRTWYWPGGEELPYFFELCDGEDEVLSALEARFGLTRVGVGTGRVALAVPVGNESIDAAATSGSITTPDGGESTPAEADRVIKLARYGPSAEMGDGRRQNRREQALWETIAAHPFLPVIDADPDGDWILMPRVRVRTADDPETEPALRAVREALNPYADRVHFDELKPENVGRWRGRDWLVDYGRPPTDGPERGVDRF